MNERDRLIELVHKAITEWEHGEVDAKIADHLIANNVTIPPVNVGQTVYLIRRPKGSLPWIAECVVSEVYVEYTADGKVCWFKSHNFEALEEDIGAWVFFTYEEAEKALRESNERKDKSI